MSNRLPIPGQDNGTWGDILNGFLEVSLYNDPNNSSDPSNGTLNSGVVGTAQIANNAVSNAQLDVPTQTAIAAVASKYVKPAGGIPSTDLSSAVQANLTSASSAVQLGGDLGGTNTSPVIAKIQGTTVASPSGGTSSFLNASGTWTIPASGAGGTAGGDLSGTYPNPTIAKLQGTTLSAPSGGATSYLNATGAWSAPTGAVGSVFTRSGAVTAQSGDYTVSQVTGAAPITSPAFSGSPTAPTIASTDNSTAIATTAFVNSISPYVSKGVFNVMHPKYGATGNGSTDDTAAINSAITDYNNNGGGVLLFPKGSSYYLTQGGHTISAPGIVMGQGYGTIAVGTNGTSVLYLATGANTNMFNLAAKSITIKDLGMYGNLGNQSSTSYGISLSVTTACNYFRLERVWVDSFHDDGIYLQGPGTSLSGIMHGVEATNCGAHGIRFNAGSAADCQLTDCIVSSNVLSGLYVNATDIVLTNCHAWGNGSSTSPQTAGDVSGLFMPSGAGGYLRVTGGYYETNGNATAGGRGLTIRGRGNIISGAVIWLNRAQGIYAYSNLNSVVTGCVVRGNNQNGGSGSGGAGILFDTCTTCSVVGCQLYDDSSTVVQTYGYAENGNTCNACLFSGNVSRAADNKTGNWLIGTGNPTATIPATPASYNVG